MQIKDLIESNLFDENEQIVILHGDVNNPIRPYTGRISDIPINLQKLKVGQVASMGEHRRNNWSLNQYGWLEIWVEVDNSELYDDLRMEQQEQM